MASRTDLGPVAEDPRFPPPRYFVTLGVVVGLGVGLARVHVLFLLVAAAGMVLLALAGRRAGYVVEDRRSVLALNAPLPGMMGPIWGLCVLLVVAANVVLRVEALPPWAVVGVAGAAGAGVAFLLREAELHRMAAVQRLERTGALPRPDDDDRAT